LVAIHEIFKNFVCWSAREIVDRVLIRGGRRSVSSAREGGVSTPSVKILQHDVT